MGPAPPLLPTKFPCWCRATYSWGGETKRDLGFIEGDLIECLNAGDGSWWMGRLRRDKRMVGLFPSNFVEVLDDGFRPMSRAASPFPPNSESNSRQKHSNQDSGSVRAASPAKSPQKGTTTSFRKPFQAYASGGTPKAAVRKQEKDFRASESPSKFNFNSRPVSRQTSFEQHSPYPSRGPSPASHLYTYSHSRDPSPTPQVGYDSSPPPPAPPPHRFKNPDNRALSPAPPVQQIQGHVSRNATPAPNSPGMMGNTPSPLRDAMEDVMTSLHDMGLSRNASLQDREGSPLNPWSPESFEQMSSRRPRLQERSRTSLGIAGEDIETDSQESFVQMGHGQFDLSTSERQLEDYEQRMTGRLRRMQSISRPPDELFLPPDHQEVSAGLPPPVPPKNSKFARPHSALSRGRPEGESTDSVKSARRLRNRKSAYELGREMLGRTFTIRSSVTTASSTAQSTSTNQSNSTGITSQSLMSTSSAGGVSATSAGSLARKRAQTAPRPMSVMETGRHGFRSMGSDTSGSSRQRPQTPLTGVTYHSSHGSQSAASPYGNWTNGSAAESGEGQGALAPSKLKKRRFFEKIIESGKTAAASARSNLAAGQAVSRSNPVKSMIPNGVTSIAGGSAARDMGLGGSGSGTIDWVQVRRDVNRSNSLSQNERIDRRERCHMVDYPVISPVDALFGSIDGDESANGQAVEEPTNFQAVNFNLVDKSARFINSLPPMTTAVSLAQGYVCRPYRSDVQRLRAIFIWVSEKIVWEEDFEGGADSYRTIQSKRGCAEEVAVLVKEMCGAVGIHAEVVRGYLKSPGEPLELDNINRPNHWWNSVVVDGEWRVMDCSLANPTNPRRSQYSSAGSQIAEGWYFLTRPTEACYSHVPIAFEQQHLCPPLPYDILMALPCACPPYFKNGLHVFDYDTSLVRLEELEIAHVHVSVPADVECVAEVETKAFQRDADGDFFESGEVVRKPALAQAEWVGGVKRYTVKALLPGDEGYGVLKVYAGKRGLMHSIKDNPHPLAFALPLLHTGTNPAYSFFTRHPTPHAQRHDLYVSQPQCARLALNNTFVFAVRQHPSSASSSGAQNGSTSPIPSIARPSSAMSMTSSQASSSQPSTTSTTYAQKKPAKLAIQAPSGKILRLMRKSEHTTSNSGHEGAEVGDGGLWETIIKVGERGVWRGLVLADRSARWCVFAEWTCA